MSSFIMALFCRFLSSILYRDSTTFVLAEDLVTILCLENGF
jgi:hypothetical protein